MGKRGHLVSAGGGGFRGLIHRKTAKLPSVQSADYLIGGSIGGVIVASLAGGLEDRLFHHLDVAESKRAFFRMPFDIKDGIIKDGFFDPSPWEKLMEKDGLCERIDRPTWVTMTDPAEDAYREVALHKCTPPEGRSAVVCTGIQSPGMEIRRFRNRVMIDAGFLHSVIPGIPKELEGKVGKITVLANSPIFPHQRKFSRSQEEVSTAWGLLGALFDGIISRVIAQDLKRLQEYARDGIEVEVYAPESFDQVFGTFDSSDEARETRNTTAEWLLSHRIRL